MVLWRTNLLGWVNITETVGQFHRNIQKCQLKIIRSKFQLKQLSSYPFQLWGFQPA